MQKLLERVTSGERERRSFRERRATPRLAVALAIQLDDGETEVMQTTHDLSTFGVSVRTGSTPPLGTRVNLKVFLPESPTEPMELEAVVLGSFDDHGGARLRFVNPSLEAVRRIHQLLK